MVISLVLIKANQHFASPVLGLINRWFRWFVMAGGLAEISLYFGWLQRSYEILFIVYFIAWFWLGDKLNATRALGLALGFTGVVLLASDVPGGISFKEGGSGLAVAACLVATFCYGISGSFTKRYLQNVPSLVTTTGSLWGASLGLGTPALLAWPSDAPSLHAWAALGIAGLMCTALAYVLFFRLMTRTGPARAMTVTYLIPVFANLLGVIFLDELVTHWMMGCAVVIVAGTALASGLVGRK
jgi:drug/metabolite transporter (DMT)-like permease